MFRVTLTKGKKAGICDGVPSTAVFFFLLAFSKKSFKIHVKKFGSRSGLTY